MTSIRIAAVLFWSIAAGFGLSVIPVARYLARHGELPTVPLLGFRAFGGGFFERLGRSPSSGSWLPSSPSALARRLRDGSFGMAHGQRDLGACAAARGSSLLAWIRSADSPNRRSWPNRPRHRWLEQPARMTLDRATRRHDPEREESWSSRAHPRRMLVLSFRSLLVAGGARPSRPHRPTSLR